VHDAADKADEATPATEVPNAISEVIAEQLDSGTGEIVEARTVRGHSAECLLESVPIRGRWHFLPHAIHRRAGSHYPHKQFRPWRMKTTNETVTARIAQDLLAVAAAAGSVVVLQLALLVARGGREDRAPRVPRIPVIAP
jgi:hypothetical protein